MASLPQSAAVIASHLPQEIQRKPVLKAVPTKHLLPTHIHRQLDENDDAEDLTCFMCE
jgi:hypothetical protein